MKDLFLINTLFSLLSWPIYELKNYKQWNTFKNLIGDQKLQTVNRNTANYQYPWCGVTVKLNIQSFIWRFKQLYLLEHKKEAAGANAEPYGDKKYTCLRGHHYPTITTEFVSTREQFPFPSYVCHLLFLMWTLHLNWQINAYWLVESVSWNHE